MSKILLSISFIFLLLGYYLFSAADHYWSEFLSTISYVFIFVSFLMAIIGTIEIRRKYGKGVIIKLLKPTIKKIIVFIIVFYLGLVFTSFQMMLSQLTDASLWGLIMGTVYVFTYPFTFISIIPALFAFPQYVLFYLFSCFVIWAYGKLRHRVKLSFLFLIILSLIFVNTNLIIIKTLDFIYSSYEKSAVEVIEETGSVENAVAECEKISEPYDYASCISNIALVKKDPMICKENIENETDYRLKLCLAPVVMDLNDTSICKLIRWEGDQNECYTALAVKNNDAEICNLCEEYEGGQTFTKSRCIFYLEKNLIPKDYEKYK